MQGLNQKARALGAVEEPLAEARTSEDAGSDVPAQMQACLEEALSAQASEAVLQHRSGIIPEILLCYRPAIAAMPEPQCIVIQDTSVVLSAFAAAW